MRDKKFNDAIFTNNLFYYSGAGNFRQVDSADSGFYSPLSERFSARHLRRDFGIADVCTVKSYVNPTNFAVKNHKEK